MKKILGAVFILLSATFLSYGQQPNEDDDVYYNDNTNVQQPANPPAEQQPYDDDDDNGAYRQDAPTYQTFYDQLSPYGTWINYPAYGYCWVPANMDPNFSPYMTNGTWVYSDLGWTWASDFAWGWGPFHYGRWFFDANYGWIWVPGYDWAPAWVIWGDYGGYYGWACLGPRDILSPHFRPDPAHWHFVEHQYMGRPDFRDHIARNEVVVQNNVDINNRINIISHANTYHQSVFFSGPKPEEVERYSGQKIQPVHINNVKQPTKTTVNNNAINIYRPNIIRTNNQHATPSNVKNVQDIPTRTNTNDNRNNTRPATSPANNNAPQQQHQNWTPPRKSPEQQVQPARQYNAPSQPMQPSHTFVPSERPAPVQHYSAPSQPHFSAPPSGGGFHGGGGRR